VAKLRDLMTESKYLKREFGEALPTFKGVMKQHQVNKLKEDWWDDMDSASQAQYIKDHPGSQQAQQADAGGGEPEDKPFGGDTGKDADFDQDTVDTDAFNAIEAGEGVNWIEEKDPSTEDMETVLRDLQRKGYKKTDDDPFKTGPETVQKYIDVLKSGKSIKYGDEYLMDDDEEDTIKKKVGIMMNQFVEDNPIEEPDKKPKEKRPGGKQAEDDYHKADMMMKKHAGKDIEKAEFWAKKKRQAADAMIGRTGKELGETKMRELLLRENPAAAAAAAMATVMLLNPNTGRKNKAITALRNKDNPSHGKAVGIFQKLRDKFTQKKKEKAEKQRRADIDVALGKMGITPRMETVNKLDESIKMHTITGNKRFMTKTAIPIMRKYGIHNIKANSVGGYFLELRFSIDSNNLKQLDKELKRKNKTAYGGIVENRRVKMTKSQLREIIREVIKEEENAFTQPIPAAIERYMKKFIDAVKGGNLNRKRKIAILGRVVVALGLEPSEVSKYARLVKRGL